MFLIFYKNIYLSLMRNTFSYYIILYLHTDKNINNTKKYSERINDIAIVQLDTSGFENLSEKQKKLTFHLAQAGLWGRFISIVQGSVHNIPLFENLINLYEKLDDSHELKKMVHESLFMMFTHVGIYHNMSGEILKLPLEPLVLKKYSDDFKEHVSYD